MGILSDHRYSKTDPVRKAIRILGLVSTNILTVIIHPIAWLPWCVEWIVRRKHPNWEFDPLTSTPYFVFLSAFSVWAIADLSFGIACFGIYLVLAMELLALWLCVTIAIGKASPVFWTLRGLARRQGFVPKDHVLLSPMALYIGAVSYSFTVYAFALFSLMLYRIDQHAYTGIEAASPIGKAWEFLYYSVVTITTLGYGDINPESFTAQLLTVIEVAIGIFLIIFFFGAFVSFHAGRLQNVKENCQQSGGGDAVTRAPHP